jgi:hypothetical protein
MPRWDVKRAIVDWLRNQHYRSTRRWPHTVGYRDRCRTIGGGESDFQMMVLNGAIN